MSFSRVHAGQVTGLRGSIVRVELDRQRGLHSFSIVGLPDKAVEESRERVSAAIKNSGFQNPKSQNQKVVVSLSPSDLKKEGAFFDLGIAMAYLLSNEEVKFSVNGVVFIGELSLDGTLRSIRGALPIALRAKEEGFTTVVLPKENAHEAGLVEGINVFGASTLKEIVDAFTQNTFTYTEHTTKEDGGYTPSIDFSDIHGQETAKRGLLIAASGGHNILLYGPPGTGKTMLAKAFAGILPSLSRETAIEVTGIHSAAGTLRETIILNPPIRAPHHSSSYVSIIGGGTFPRPGEVTLAHKGVLFLDEFPEFDKRVIETLREPLEERIVSISRAKGTEVFPSHFILVAAMNPCPCGYAGTTVRRCVCAPQDIIRYKKKLSGPILDRIDIALSVEQIPYEKLQSANKEGESLSLRNKVERTRAIQRDRFIKQNSKKELNAELSSKELGSIAPLSKEVETLLRLSAEKLQLSPRAYHRVIKLARTIADIDEDTDIKERHILEALQYRPKLFS